MKKFAAGLVILLLLGGVALGSTTLGTEVATTATQSEQYEAYRRIGLGAAAAFAVAISIVGAGHAVGKIGSAALGAAVEKPELLIRSLLFIALAEGLAVLGFAVAMMIIQKM